MKVYSYKYLGLGLWLGLGYNEIKYCEVKLRFLIILENKGSIII